MLREFAVDFQPPQRAAGGPDNTAAGPGSTAGSRTCSASSSTRPAGRRLTGRRSPPASSSGTREVGKRSVGISTFWFQAVCQNHIVWDATEVVEFTRKHTGKVGEALGDIRRIVEALVEKRDARRDGFVAVMKKAMETKLGDDAEEAMKAPRQARYQPGPSRSAASRSPRRRAVHHLRRGRCPHPLARELRERRRPDRRRPEGGRLLALAL